MQMAERHEMRFLGTFWAQPMGGPLLGTGRAVTTDHFGNIVLTARRGTPILLRDVGEVRIGSRASRGRDVTQWRDDVRHAIAARSEDRSILRSVLRKAINSISSTVKQIGTDRPSCGRRRFFLLPLRQQP